MTRQRLRPAYTADELARLYPQPHNHTRWPDHLLRVETTIQVGHWMVVAARAETGADLSCGNGAILDGLPLRLRYFGDLAPATYRFSGPIHDTIALIPAVDVFVCCETLEHLDDPDKTLTAIRGKTSQLLLSTPVDAWNDTNPEHYWAWSRDDVDRMLADAGFTTFVYTEVDFRPGGLPYSFGIWGAR
jgi:hypothetical protein